MSLSNAISHSAGAATARTGNAIPMRAPAASIIDVSPVTVSKLASLDASAEPFANSGSRSGPVLQRLAALSAPARGAIWLYGLTDRLTAQGAGAGAHIDLKV